MSSRLIFLLAALITTWVLAFNSGRELAFNIAYLISGVLLFSYGWAMNSIRGLGLRRYTRTRRSQVGQYAEEQFEVNNRSWWPKLWIEIEDHSTLPWHPVSRVISSLGRQSSQRWQVRSLCTQRGRFRLGPLVLHSGDPLGIFSVHQELSDTSQLIVYPMVVDLVSFEPSIADLAGGEARHRRTYQITSNVAGVREYVHGDSLNRIHWPTTARVRRFMVKEFELDPTADVWLYLDLNQAAEAALPWTPMPPELGFFAPRDRKRQERAFELPPNTTEYAVTIAASLARYFVVHNRAIGVSSWGERREYIQSDRGERQLNKILEALAVIEADGTLPFSHLISTDGIRLNRNDTLIAISADPNREWALALQQIQRRGVNSIAIVVDGSTFGGAQPYDALLIELEAANIPTYIVHRNDALDQALAQPTRLATRPANRYWG
ncbi:MAG: DUF58 domain-containing protein [Caldilineaceae bacterium]|nr:DUF58 domain-containing protein [Caldilineaceae bacterium]